MSAFLASLALWLPLGGGQDLVGQETRITPRPLASGHWAYDYAELLHAMGAPQAWPVWQEPLPAGPLVNAGATAPGADAQDGMTRTWTDLLRTESGLAPGQWARLGLSAGYETSQVSLLPERGAYLEGMAEVPLGSTVALWAEGGYATESSEAELTTGGLAWGFGAGQLVVGRIRPRIGQGTSRLLLAGRASMDGVLLGTGRPFVLPGFLRFLGRTTAHIFVSPNISSPTTERAWMATVGASIEPHPAITLGGYRATRFGGKDLEGADADAGSILALLTGLGGDDDFDDGKGELSARVRFRAWGQPVATYASLGFEDLPSIVEDPAVVAGVLLPFTVGASVLSARYEYQAFGPGARWCGPCRDQSHRWYSQRVYGPYTLDDVPLGSSLGGYGRRHQVELSYWGRIPLRISAIAFVEDRDEENLLFDQWPGTRTGAALLAAWRPRPGWELALGGIVTDRESATEGGLNLTFRVFDAFSNPAGAHR